MKRANWERHRDMQIRELPGGVRHFYRAATKGGSRLLTWWWHVEVQGFLRTISRGR